MIYRYFLLMIGIFFAVNIHAQPISVIRDTEIETLLESYIKQAFKVAQLDENRAKIVLLQDDTINAFVAGGHTIFIHTGLITRATCPDDVMFVIAHETGHIKGGHTVRGIENYKNMQTTSLISGVLGGVLAVATGRPDAGLAVMMGGQQTAANSFLSYRQTEESAADRTAVDIMKQTHYSMKGFVNLTNEIKRQERLQPQRQTGYLSSHPLTQTRQMDLSRFIENAPTVHQEEAFDRAKAKLFAFLYPPKQTLSVYKGNSDVDIYAQAIAQYKLHHLQEAVRKTDELIQREQNNPYFYELKGQFLFESGQIEEAIRMYRTAVALAPNKPLLQIALAQALLERENPKYAQEAIRYLSFSILNGADVPMAWQLLATAYYRAGEPFKANYAMAEYYFMTKQNQQAQNMAQKVVDNMPANSFQVKKAKEILYQLSKKD